MTSNSSLPLLSASLSVGGDVRPLIEVVFLATVLILLIGSCVIGNFLVILAIFLERELRARPQCYLILSLAVADLIVGLIVTPLGAWTTVTGTWQMGVMVCDIWISVDVLVCTASILHLVAIALDRYWSITDICYAQNRTPKRITGMLAVIWLTSLLISLAPVAGWKDEGFEMRVQKQQVCLISQQISYQVFSTATAFYIPLIAIIVIYWKIMRAAKKRFKRERDRRTVIRAPIDDKQTPLISKKSKKITHTTTISDVLSDNRKISRVSHDSRSTSSEEEKKQIACLAPKETKTINTPKARMLRKTRRSKENYESRRERRAWRTLAIITGTFVACWTPFFLVSLYRPVCACTVPPIVEQVTAWLGYLNSALNPIIYTVFSNDFRSAFKRIIQRLCLFKGL